MMEKIPITPESELQHYTPHLKKVLKTYQKSAIKSLQGPSTVLATDAVSATMKKEPASESSPELPLETPPPPPVPQVPILSTADQSAELSETLIEGYRISCFIIGGEKRICFVQLLSTVLRNVQAYTINNVCTELFINFSSCNSEQLLALKAKGLLPAETPTCGLVTKPDAERLCSVLLHEGGAAPEGLDKHSQSSFYVYHECFSGAKGLLYYEFYNEQNWCVQCDVCRRLFTPQMFVCHSCFKDNKRNSIHTYIETGICHWGFDSTNWRLYIHVLETQPEYEKFTEVLENFKKHHVKSDLIRLKRKQVTPPEICEPVKPVAKSVIEETLPPKIEDEEEEERWYLKKKAKVVTAGDDGSAVTCATIPSYYGSFHTYYSNLCDSWVRNAAAAAGYHHPTTWPNYPPIPFTKDSKSYYFTESVPAFLTQGPPVLLNPERVVSLSQCEQFERSFQPNVALAPPAKPTTADGMTYSKLKRGVIRVKSDLNGPAPSTAAEPPPPPPAATLYYKNDEEEDIKPRPISPTVPTLPPVSSPRNSPLPEPAPDNGVNSVVDQVAAVLDALSDAEDAVRQRVINLVDRLTFRIDKCENERQKYQDEMLQLRTRLAQVQEENVQLFYENNQLRQQIEIKVEEEDHTTVVTSLSVSTVTTPALNTSPGGGTVLNNASYPYSNRSTPGISSKQPHCSPVSVITSPPPLSSIKSESSA